MSQVNTRAWNASPIDGAAEAPSEERSRRGRSEGSEPRRGTHHLIMLLTNGASGRWEPARDTACSCHWLAARGRPACSTCRGTCTRRPGEGSCVWPLRRACKRRRPRPARAACQPRRAPPRRPAVEAAARAAADADAAGGAVRRRVRRRSAAPPEADGGAMPVMDGPSMARGRRRDGGRQVAWPAPRAGAARAEPVGDGARGRAPARRGLGSRDGGRGAGGFAGREVGAGRASSACGGADRRDRGRDRDRSRQRVPARSPAAASGPREHARSGRRWCRRSPASATGHGRRLDRPSAGPEVPRRRHRGARAGRQRRAPARWSRRAIALQRVAEGNRGREAQLAVLLEAAQDESSIDSGSRVAAAACWAASGASTRWRLTMPMGESARNGMSPVTIWYRITAAA